MEALRSLASDFSTTLGGVSYKGPDTETGTQSQLRKGCFWSKSASTCSVVPGGFLFVEEVAFAYRLRSLVDLQLGFVQWMDDIWPFLFLTAVKRGRVGDQRTCLRMSSLAR